jgi:hypothetical protein
MLPLFDVLFFYSSFCFSWILIFLVLVLDAVWMIIATREKDTVWRLGWRGGGVDILCLLLRGGIVRSERFLRYGLVRGRDMYGLYRWD